ncbi:NADPH-ferrihemo protein reductase [Kockovaella imperatae]|uniref:NADPH-dependent diflavin oxidoreductase 1 n=1 Tax=Kockovaella imperatae TaxID=4999 RepID=A0A1Y1UF20_9TREE|nr:NADPH-ferrihemo protein reductase [Kockovaella imperatae]ORX36114.1 NADPH-ferrihemo protein reductase [Kockovaella imperatae]
MSGFVECDAGSSSGDSAISPEHIVVLYASETGNSQDIAERVGRECRRRGGKCVVVSMDMFDISELPHTPLLILITSTHGQGEPPPAMKRLWSALIRSVLPTDILEDVRFAIYGLGDSSYEKFCYAGKMLARRMLGLSAHLIGQPAWGDERAPDGLEETFLPWLEQTMDLMIPLLPAALKDVETAPGTALPPPLYSIEFEQGHLPDITALEINGDGNEKCVIEAAPVRSIDKNRGETSELSKPDDWGWATLSKNQRVTSRDWWQDVREIELDIEDDRFRTYVPGSICGLQPKNSAEDVETFLEMINLTSVADDELRIHSNIEDQPVPAHLPPADSPTTLRSLLLNHLDLRASPRKSFFEWLRRLTPDETERERLDDFLGDPNEIHDYATRPSRTILETLADFRYTRIPLSHILEILPPLRRRQFSIASSSSAHPGKIQLLIALVEYKTNLKIPRKGLCSSWLKDLRTGSKIAITIDPPTMFLPSHDDYLVLVGPGTGIAPMRAFVEERIRQGAAKRTILYFGCRSRSNDLYYSSEWTRYETLGFKLRVAASRDQDEKVYVQHLIKEDRATINQWLYDCKGYIFISGSSNAMPRQVREAVSWCLSTDGAGKLSSGEATTYVEDMFEDGHGMEESW